MNRVRRVVAAFHTPQSEQAYGGASPASIVRPSAVREVEVRVIIPLLNLENPDYQALLTKAWQGTGHGAGADYESFALGFKVAIASLLGSLSSPDAFASDSLTLEVRADGPADALD